MCMCVSVAYVQETKDFRIGQVLLDRIERVTWTRLFKTPLAEAKFADVEVDPQYYAFFDRICDDICMSRSVLEEHRLDDYGGSGATRAVREGDFLGDSRASNGLARTSWMISQPVGCWQPLTRLSKPRTRNSKA